MGNKNYIEIKQNFLKFVRSIMIVYLKIHSFPSIKQNSRIWNIMIIQQITTHISVTAWNLTLKIFYINKYIIYLQVLIVMKKLNKNITFAAVPKNTISGS